MMPADRSGRHNTHNERSRVGILQVRTSTEQNKYENEKGMKRTRNKDAARELPMRVARDAIT